MIYIKKIIICQSICVFLIIFSISWIRASKYTKDEIIDKANVVTIEEDFVSMEEFNNGPNNAYLLKTNNSKFRYRIWNENLFKYKLFLENVNVGDSLIISVYDYYPLEDAYGRLIPDYHGADVCGLQTNQYEFLNPEEYINHHNNQIKIFAYVDIALMVLAIGCGVVLVLTFIKEIKLIYKTLIENTN